MLQVYGSRSCGASGWSHRGCIVDDAEVSSGPNHPAPAEQIGDFRLPNVLHALGLDDEKRPHAHGMDDSSNPTSFTTKVAASSVMSGRIGA